tara:strand:+ start:448 stop:765 length:318 start_codon:yes stop_codon:yes gene_type:complete
MPKNQNLGALEKAILDIAASEASPAAAARLARIEAGRKKAMQDRIDAVTGKTNPMLDAVKAFTPGFKDGGKVKGYRHGGKASCKSKSKTRGMGAAMRGGNFSGVR